MIFHELGDLCFLFFIHNENPMIGVQGDGWRTRAKGRPRGIGSHRDDPGRPAPQGHEKKEATKKANLTPLPPPRSNPDLDSWSRPGDRPLPSQPLHTLLPSVSSPPRVP